MDDLAIVGGGPAGASAAIFAARAGFATRVLDADKGSTRRAMLWNHLGYPDGITGPDLVERGRQQAIRAGAAWETTDVTGLERKDDGFVLRTADGRAFEAKRVLLTTGTSLDLVRIIGVEVRTATEPRTRDTVVVDSDGRTSTPGIWAAGTVIGVSRHTIVTAGDGARVAINIISEVKGERHIDHDSMPKT